MQIVCLSAIHSDCFQHRRYDSDVAVEFTFLNVTDVAKIGTSIITPEATLYRIENFNFPWRETLSVLTGLINGLLNRPVSHRKPGIG